VGRVQIDTHTADATILLDGKEVGRGVWEGPVPTGQHDVTIAAPGFRTYKRAFLVHEGETFVEDTPLVPEGVAMPTPTYEGIYSGLAFLGYAAPTGATNQIAQSCPEQPCSSSSPLGAGLAVRVGYSFGWIAIEGLVLGTYDHASASVSYDGQLTTGDFAGPARNESYDFHRFGGGAAVGVRVASKHPHVRFTASAMGGFAYMGNVYDFDAVSPTGADESKDTSKIVTYVAPLFAFDAGVLVGWANGAKVHLSLLTMLQVVGDPVTSPNFGMTPFNEPSIAVAQGTEVFVGPMLGLDFGL
jgi:hypothetical protein